MAKEPNLKIVYKLFTNKHGHLEPYEKYPFMTFDTIEEASQHVNKWDEALIIPQTSWSINYED